jgi:hypothetical protein
MNRFTSFLELLSPAQRTSLLLAQGVFAAETSEHQNAKCSERFPDFQGSSSEVPRGENEQSVPTNTPSTKDSKFS